MTCTPSTPAPARKRRRPNQDLQERLARCEALLKQYAGASGAPPPPPSTATIQTGDSHPVTPSTTTQNDHSGPSPSTSASDSYEKPPAGRMVQQEGGARFIDSQLWTSFYDEVR